MLPAQDDDWSALKTDFPRGSFVSVQDFSENHHHIVRNEPQAKYYQSVDSTLYMVVVRYHLDDATKLPDEVRDELRATYASVDRPPIIVETLAFVSADRKHDNAFVRHVNDRYVVPYMQSIGDFSTHYARSDGCKSQFKCAMHFDWVSRRQSETGMRTDWSFFCSCHGKCDCDPEGGSIKSAAANWERHGDLEGMRVQAKLPDAASFVKWANEGSAAGSPHGYHAGLTKPKDSLSTKLRWGRKNAIWRRQFINVPTTGPQAVSRIYSECTLDGSARMHSFVDVGTPGLILWRERSCHQCDNCWAGKASTGCSDEKRFGRAVRMPITYPKKPESSLARTLRSVQSKPLPEMIKAVTDGQYVCVIVKDNPHEPWMLGRAGGGVEKATAKDVKEAAELGFTIKVGAEVLRLIKFEPFELGSRRYIETKVPLVVPATALRRGELKPNNVNELRKSARIKNQASRYGDSTFEVKEEDLRAIVAILGSEIGDFKVDKLLAHRVVVQRGKQVDQFQVKWQGWEREEDLTWEPLSAFGDDEALLAEAADVKAKAAAAAQAATEERAATAQREAEQERAAVEAAKAEAEAAAAEHARREQEAAAQVAAAEEAEAAAAAAAAAEAAAAKAAAEATAAEAAAAEAGADEVASTEQAAREGTSKAGATNRALTQAPRSMLTAESGAERDTAAAAASSSASRAAEEAKLSRARAEEAKEAAAKAAAAVVRAEQASRQITVRAGYFESLKEMLSLAGREVVPVAGDGNCGFYAFLGCEDAIEHCRGRTRAPTARDYAAQQNLREECVKWLQDRPQLTGWHAGMDAVSNSRRQSSWSDAAIKKLEGGKLSTSDNMGVYANEAALRAMAGLRKEPLVVVDSKAGPSLSKQVRNRPPDQVAVYETHAGPEDKPRWFASVMRWMSWANDIAPVLQRRLEGNQLEDDPKYRVIVHNGEPASSLGGHFDATRVVV